MAILHKLQKNFFWGKFTSNQP